MNPSLRERDRVVQEAANEAAAHTRAWVDENIALGGVCDFCCNAVDLATAQTWVTTPIVETVAMLDLDTLGAGRFVNALDDWWAACPACDPVIAERDPELLADHVVRTRGPRAPKIRPGDEGRIRADLVDLYRRFFAGGARREKIPAGG